MRTGFVVLVALLMGQSAPVLAQAASSIAPGTRVRVHTAATIPLTGRLVGAADSQLTVQVGAEQHVVSMADIRRIEVGRSRSGVGKGVRTGAIVGGLAGLVLGIAALSEDDSWFDYGPEVIPAGMAGGALMGAGLGFVIGAMSTREEWTTVPSGPAIAITTRGRGVGVSVRF